jgi:hypothetical protein
MSIQNKEPGTNLSGESLQRTIGCAGIALPFVCFAVGFFSIGQLLPSISAFYYTGAHGFFVATLCILGASLFAYQGFDDMDNRLGNIGAVCALGVGLFPTRAEAVGKMTGEDLEKNIGPIVPLSSEVCGIIHNVSAIGLFIMFVVFSGYLFLRKGPTEHSLKTMLDAIPGYLQVFRKDDGLSSEEDREDRIHRICALIMAGILIVFATFKVFKIGMSQQAVFWVETLAINAFGISWLTKSEMKGKTVLVIAIAICLLIMFCVYLFKYVL